MIARMLEISRPDRPRSYTAQRMAEDQLSLLWYSDVCVSAQLRTRGGRRVRVLYRGLPNGDRGPDYLGAVVSLGRGRPRSGDIELHLRSSQWRAHGHHLDARYNGVVLHVVWEDDNPGPTVLSSGRQVPVLALAGVLQLQRPPAFPEEPCRQEPGPDLSRLCQVLDRAGLDRFWGKSARLEGDMSILPAGEVLYQSLSESLGYSHNKASFRRLAASLPLAVLEGYLWGQDPSRREAMAEALLMGAAGLLPTQRGLGPGPGWPSLLEARWEGSGREGHLAPADWSLGVRPDNHPVRRLAGLACMVVASLEEGLVDWMMGVLRGGYRFQEARANPDHTTPSTLSPEPLALYPGPGRRREMPWERQVRGYWRDHFDFGRPGARLSAFLIGPGRALEVAANVLLPFAHALGQTVGDEELSQAAEDTFCRLLAPCSNQVTRHMAGQLMAHPDARALATARRHQGLLHLFHSYCTRGRCGVCPLGRTL